MLAVRTWSAAPYFPAQRRNKEHEQSKNDRERRKDWLAVPIRVMEMSAFERPHAKQNY
jgi:hypothetical protein